MIAALLSLALLPITAPISVAVGYLARQHNVYDDPVVRRYLDTQGR